MKYDVSVILAIYNPSFSKLKATLQSVLNQTGISMELIFADDGSSVTYWEEIKAILEENHFSSYQFSILEKNSGVVQNYNHALKLCQGEYVKPISPGDMLFHPTLLRDWVTWLRQRDCRISFGEAGYYCQEENGEIRLFRHKMPPVNVALYDGNHREDMLIWYLLGEDTISGATMILERELYTRYMELQAGKVIWLDDMILRPAVFEGIPILAYPHPVMWYEYGSGISTTGNDIWMERCWKDFCTSDDIIRDEMEPVDAISRQYQRYLRMRGSNGIYNRMLKFLMFPRYLPYRLKAGKIMRYTDDTLNTDYLSHLLKEASK